MGAEKPSGLKPWVWRLCGSSASRAEPEEQRHLQDGWREDGCPQGKPRVWGAEDGKARGAGGVEGPVRGEEARKGPRAVLGGTGT